MDTQSPLAEDPTIVSAKPDTPSLSIIAFIQNLSLRTRIVFGVGILLLLILTLVGLSVFFSSKKPAGSVAPTRTVTLTYWTMVEQTPQMQDALTEFSQANPGVSVTYSYQSPKEYSQRLFSACTRGQCPDVFQFHPTWIPSYQARSMFTPLPSSVMSASVYTSTFFPSAAKDLTTPQGIVGIPLSYDSLGLFINTRLLTESGKSVPRTWDDVRTLARLLTVRDASGSIDRAGIAMGTATNVDHFSDILAALILQNSGDPIRPEPFESGETSGPYADKPSLVGDALTFYSLFSKTDRVWDETLPNSTYAFAIERAAMIFAPAYRAAEIKKINPNFAFAVHPLPQLPGDPVVPANYWAYGVSSYSKEQELSWKLLAFLSSRNIQERLYPETADALRNGVSSRQDMMEVLSSNPYVGAIAQQSAVGKMHALPSRTFDKSYNDNLIALYAGLVTTLQSQSSYGQLAPVFVQNVQKVFQ